MSTSSTTSQNESQRRCTAIICNQTEGAYQIGWFLGTTDAWVAKYFNPGDPHSVERELLS